MVHPQYNFERRSACVDITTSDSSSIERLPEENVSIVETLEGREDRPDTVKAITGSTRRKLYFNPAYFEPHLLLVGFQNRGFLSMLILIHCYFFRHRHRQQ